MSDQGTFKEFFRAMAAVHVRQSPPGSPVLNAYGQDFDAFIRTFAPAASVPYLADVARLLSLGSLRVGLQPSVAVLESPYAMLSIWLAHQGVGQLELIDPNYAEAALILRCQWQVEVFRIDHASQVFIRLLLDGQRLETALDSAHAASCTFDPAQTLGLLIRHGAITRLQTA